MRPVVRSSTLIDAVSLCEQAVGEVRADEPGAPGHQDGRHGANLSCGSAPMSSDGRARPEPARAAPTHAIIAALSVTELDGRRRRGGPRFAASAIRSRSRVLATTPPPSSTVSARPRPWRRRSSWPPARRRSPPGSSRRGRAGPGRGRPPAPACTYRSTAVFSPLIEKSSRRNPPSRAGSGSRAGSPSRASRVERRPAGEPEAQQPRHLVEGLARRVVERLAEDLVAVDLRHVHEHRVSAADDQAPRTAARAARAPGSSPR